ncbi:hypothetical protein, partial [Xanthomonas arboricola]|uniref:hypothetical protein n=1 Tax=Xanthomonas arboricola TaxID=56448 RepID=UPI0019558F6E
RLFEVPYRGLAGILEKSFSDSKLDHFFLFFTNPCRPSILLYNISMQSNTSVRSLGAEGFNPDSTGTYEKSG